MTLQEIKLLTAFNAWASSRIFDAVAALPVEDTMKDMKSSHGNIHGTLFHMVAAEHVWLARWTGTKDARMLPVAEAPTLESLRKFWERVGFETARFLAALNDKKLQESFVLTTTRGESLHQILWQSIQHVVDHSTYHRGQVVTMMRQLGHVPPGSGLIQFYRETAKRGTA